MLQRTAGATRCKARDIEVVRGGWLILAHPNRLIEFFPVLILDFDFGLCLSR